MHPRVIFSSEELMRLRAHGHLRDQIHPKRIRKNGKTVKFGQGDRSAATEASMELSELSETMSHVLLKVKALFPFDFFPDEVIIDINRVNIIKRNFFISARVHGIPVANILDVFVEHGPIFAALKIVDSGFIENEISVNYLWKKDAEEARGLIQGLIDAKKQGVDLTKVSHKNIGEKLTELGSITPSKPN